MPVGRIMQRLGSSRFNLAAAAATTARTSVPGLLRSRFQPPQALQMAQVRSVASDARPLQAGGRSRSRESRRAVGSIAAAALVLGSPLFCRRRRALSAVAVEPAEVSFLDQASAIKVDVDLMSPEGGFSIDQLMELAGLSCACSLAKVYPLPETSKVLIIAGPGNNGGDGLVMARHLRQFGYTPTVVYPVQPKNELYQRLLVQLNGLGIEVLKELPATGLDGFDVAVDAVFGFSFKGWRGGGRDAPFDKAVELFAAARIPVLAVDIPSGWDVEKGPSESANWQPDTLISLTAPKLCAREFRGRYHFLGGRFVPTWLQERYELKLPSYAGSEQCVLIAGAPRL